jgi:hypothetical protein
MVSLKSALECSRRPHFLYGTRESRLSLNPIQLQPLSLCKEYSFFEKYHPCEGSVSVASDVVKIQQLVDELKPYMSSPTPTSSAFPSPLVTSHKRPVNLIATHSRSLRHLTPEKKTTPPRDHSPFERGGSRLSSPLVAIKKIKTGTPPIGSPKRCSSPLATHRSSSSVVRLSPQIVPSSLCSSSTSPLTNSEMDMSHLVRKTLSNVSPFLDEQDSVSRVIDKKKKYDEDSVGSDDEDDEDILSECESLHSVDQDCEIVSLTKDSSSKQLFLTQQSTLPPSFHTSDHLLKPSSLSSLSSTSPLPSSSQSRKTCDMNGCLYYGEYKGNDVRHGHGQLHYPNGDIFHGLFKDNYIHGTGKYIYGNGDVYIGQWKYGYRHGKGIHTSISDGDGEITSIQEVYHNGHKIKGKFIFSDYIFIGTLNKQGEKEGQKCSVKYTSGDVYEGKYSHDQREGYGKYVSANGDVYEGYYHHHLRHGKGKFKSHLGDLFTGEYKNDKKDCNSGV